MRITRGRDVIIRQIRRNTVLQDLYGRGGYLYRGVGQEGLGQRFRYLVQVFTSGGHEFRSTRGYINNRVGLVFAITISYNGYTCARGLYIGTL